LLADPDYVRDIMATGAQKARAVGTHYLNKAKEAIGLNY